MNLKPIYKAENEWIKFGQWIDLQSHLSFVPMLKELFITTLILDCILKWQAKAMIEIYRPIS